MTQPAQPAAPAHIPGLITAAGVTPAVVPGQPVAAAQPGMTVPAPAEPSAVTSAVTAAPVVPAAPVSAAPTAEPVMTAAQWAALLPTSLPAQQPAVPAVVPGLNPPATAAPVPGLNPPAAPAPADPAATPPPAAPANTEVGNGLDDGAGKDYPEGKPLAEMTGDEKAAYYRWYSRQWEGRAKAKGDYDALKAKAEQYDAYVASQATETEKQIAAARADGERTATARAAVVLVDAHVRAGLQQRLQPHQVEALASNLNHQHFLGADGLSVDAAKVAAFVDTVAPGTAFAATAPAAPAAPGALPVTVPTPGAAGQPVTGLPRALPDLGQGAQTTAPLDKLEAGRQQARAFLAGGHF